MSAVSSVVDASALLAFVFGESGGSRLLGMIGETPAMSAVNWSEVSQKAIAYAVPVREAGKVAAAAGLDVVPLTLERAEHVATLWAETRALGLSLADRACLSLGLEFACPVVTAERAWQRLELEGLDVRVLR